MTDAFSFPRGAAVADVPDVGRAAFVDAMRRVPGTVAIVATALDGERRGLAATAWCSLSADPPMILACVNRGASAHPFLLSAGAFAVNLLAPSHTETVSIFSAQRGLDGDARFAAIHWSAGLLGQPLLDEALVHFECRLVDAHDYGSHTIMIGRVVGVGGKDGAAALIYVNGAYAVAETIRDASGDLP